ncbi:hypothetical protein QR680_017209 [Steinernema hermaphroditum]|uniref:Uncharacterized protein n=1 Tax=Steinernema hermaphroditum TaxID=289476 RepID=A0AA39HG52_9BILA|nr:hypothetical protein QR680_017209 [Steinernema hermaphroditum]
MIRAYRRALSSEDLTVSNRALQMFPRFARHLEKQGAVALVQLAMESCRRSNIGDTYLAVGDAVDIVLQ